MAGYVLIETSTALCSCALSENGKIVNYRESREPKAHASLTAVFIDDMLRETGWQLSDLAGVCVSSGPGSYTGLRVGVSTAKGLCFGAGIPLIAIPTTDILVEQARLERFADHEFIVPMIDARRMEVYQAVYQRQENGSYRRITPVSPLVVEEDSYAMYLAQGRVLFVGDGAGKCSHLSGEDVFFTRVSGDREKAKGGGPIRSYRASFHQCNPSAKYMASLAAGGEKVDTAYFEPFYLKEFVATQSKKKLF